MITSNFYQSEVLAATLDLTNAGLIRRPSDASRCHRHPGAPGEDHSRRNRVPGAGAQPAGQVFTALAGILDDGLLELDDERRVVQANDWWEQWPAPLAARLAGAPLEYLIVDADGGLPEKLAAWDRGGHRGPLQHQVRLAVESPQPLWVELTLRRFESGGTAGHIAIVRDISAMRAALARERELNALKSTFVTMVSHEFRNPLTAIMSATELLQAQTDAERAAQPRATDEYLAAIFGASERMCRLMDELLLLGRIESGALRFNPFEVSPVELCHSLLGELPSAEDRARVELATEVGAEVTASLDPVLVRHVLLNLLSNALKYSPAGRHVTLGVRVQAGELCFEVTDRGIGIPEAEQARLFDAFFRASNAGALRGTGVGLSIARECARQHGGRLSFQSVVGEGSAFSLRLPLGRSGESAI